MGPGSQTLANVLSQIRYDGTVAACGLARGPDLPATVMPFILRDVTLSGVNSVETPREKREKAWGQGPRFCQAQHHDVTRGLMTYIVWLPKLLEAE
jgi:NADPH:quinone reductase-like Zn-dependent oxidoreductase